LFFVACRTCPRQYSCRFPRISINAGIAGGGADQPAHTIQGTQGHSGRAVRGAGEIRRCGIREKPACGSVGEAAIFTDHVKASHVIRKVLLRQVAILNYVNPF
jgi:hypothetical protein